MPAASPPTLEERKDWWVKIYAKTSFEHSLRTCQLLLTQVTSNKEPLFFPLAVAIHAFYGRPFLRQFGAGNLEKDYVPEEGRLMHDQLMTLRCKFLVHTDANPIKQAGRPLHDVVYKNDGSSRTYIANDVCPRLEYIREVARYLPVLIEKVKSDIDDIHRRFGDLVPTAEGEYRLNLADDALFSPYEQPDNTLKFDPPS